MSKVQLVDLVRFAKYIDNTSEYKKLIVLGDNGKRLAKDAANGTELMELVDKAYIKARKVRLLSKCPMPIDDSELEQKAFNLFVDSSAIMDKFPSVRVIYHQLNKLGYAKTMAKQVSKSVGGGNFETMCKSGLVKYTSEYFVLNNAKHLVDEKVYTEVVDLFKSNPHLQVSIPNA